MSKFNYFKYVTVDTTSFENCEVDFGFITTGILLLVDSTDPADAVEYSFLGETGTKSGVGVVHGDLIPGGLSEGIAMDNRHESKIWFRTKNSGKTVRVRVEAWGS